MGKGATTMEQDQKLSCKYLHTLLGINVTSHLSHFKDFNDGTNRFLPGVRVVKHKIYFLCY